MKPGFTMAEADTAVKKIKMRQDRIKHIHMELIRLNDCIRIMEDEISDLRKMG